LWLVLLLCTLVVWLLFVWMLLVALPGIMVLCVAVFRAYVAVVIVVAVVGVVAVIACGDVVVCYASVIVGVDRGVDEVVFICIVDGVVAVYVVFAGVIMVCTWLLSVLCMVLMMPSLLVDLLLLVRCAVTLALWLYTMLLCVIVLGMPLCVVVGVC